MRSILTSHSIPMILLFAIFSIICVLIITYWVQSAKKKIGVNMIYLVISGIFLGIVGIRATALNNPFYFYLIVLCWNLLAGGLHAYLSVKILAWPRDELFGWRFLFATAIVLFGFSVLLTFMRMVDYNFLVLYNFSAVLTFFIPITMVYAFEAYQLIPQKIYLPQKPWIYNKSNELQFRSEDISHFFIIKYGLTAQVGGEMIQSMPMRAPGQIKLGEYFNSTLENYKVNQGRYSIEVRDRSNNYYGWYFFLSHGKSGQKLLDPNKTLIECGLTTPVYFGTPIPEEIENITNQSDREGRSYLILCKREIEYKSQLLHT